MTATTADMHAKHTRIFLGLKRKAQLGRYCGNFASFTMKRQAAAMRHWDHRPNRRGRSGEYGCAVPRMMPGCRSKARSITCRKETCVIRAIREPGRRD